MAQAPVIQVSFRFWLETKWTTIVAKKKSKNSIENSCCIFGLTAIGFYFTIFSFNASSTPSGVGTIPPRRP